MAASLRTGHGSLRRPFLNPWLRQGPSSSPHHLTSYCAALQRAGHHQQCVPVDHVPVFLTSVYSVGVQYPTQEAPSKCVINGKGLSQLRLLGQNTTDSWAASTADIDFSQFGRLGNLRSGEDLLLADGRPPSGSGLNSHGLSSVCVWTEIAFFLFS